jgi:hypothetical protein
VKLCEENKVCKSDSMKEMNESMIGIYQYMKALVYKKQKAAKRQLFK